MKITKMELAKIDLEEVQGALGLSSSIMAIFYSISNSKEIHVIIDEDTEAIIAIMGIAEKVGYDNVLTGVPWVLGTEKFHAINSRGTRSFLNLAQVWFERWRHQYKQLENFVATKNTKSIRWLKWLGFIVDTDNKWYLIDKGIPFFRFYT